MKTANNKIPGSSVFNDSEGLYGTTVCRRLVRRPHYSARQDAPGAANAFRVTWSERVRHRNALTEIAWEDAVQGLDMARPWHGMLCLYRSVREKQGNVVFRQRVLQTVTPMDVVSLVFRGYDLRKL